MLKPSKQDKENNNYSTEKAYRNKENKQKLELESQGSEKVPGEHCTKKYLVMV